MSAPTGVTIKGDQHVAWGAGSTFTWTKDAVEYTAQIVKSCRKTVDGEEATVPGSVGHTVGHILFDDRNEAEVEVVWRDNEVYPARRDMATVAGVSGLVLKVENTWENRGVRGCRVTVKRFDNTDYGDAESSSESAS